MMGYSEGAARIYDSIGIKGSTYEIGYREVARILGGLHGQIFLDFGAGAGRSSALLVELGAKRVVAIDQDVSMLAVARAKHFRCIDFILSRGAVPLRDATVDGVISLCVFVELRTRRALRRVSREIARVVKANGPVVIMSTNPLAVGHTFRNFRFSRCGTQPRSGARITCTIANAVETIEVEDTYWTEMDYIQALETAGLSVEEVTYPKAAQSEQWSTDEYQIAPFVVISLRATGRLPARDE